MKITDLIGKRVSKVRFKHEVDQEEGFQKFQSQVKLSDGNFVLFPTDPDDKVEMTEHYENNKSCAFIEAKRCGLAYRLAFKKKRIVDVHFKYLDGAHFSDSKGIIELENGKYLMENSFGPMSSTDINLMVLNKGQFQQLQEAGMELRSFKNDLSVS